MAAEGLNYREIAARLYVIISTVKSHAARAKVKLNLSGAAQRGPAYSKLTSG